MNYSDYRFTLDVQVHQAQVSVPVMLGDTARRLFISLSDGRKPYYIADGCRAVLVAQKPDGTSIFNDCIIENNSTIVYQFTPNTTSAEGIVNCEVRLYGENRLITSAKFIIVVDAKVIRDEEILSESEHTTLDNIIMSEKSRVAAEAARVDAEAERKRRFDSGELNGEDGYTPVRGKDYWTPEDVAAINEDINKRVDEKSSMIGGFIPVTAPVWKSGAKIRHSLATITSLTVNSGVSTLTFNEKTEMFSDGSFEHYDTGDSLVPLMSPEKNDNGWSALSVDGLSARYARIKSDGTSHGGSNYVSIKAPYSSIWKSLKLKPNTDYKLSYWIRRTSTNKHNLTIGGKLADSNVYYKDVANGGGNYGCNKDAYRVLLDVWYNTDTSLSGEWQKLSFAFRTLDEEYIDICIHFNADWGVVDFDDFSVEENLGEVFTASYAAGVNVPAAVKLGAIFYVDCQSDYFNRFEHASSQAVVNLYKDLTYKISSALQSAGVVNESEE